MTVVGRDVLVENGHMSFSLWAASTRTPKLGGENRCDLHSCWSRDGRRVCIDSVHESQRQMYLIDVSRITGA